MFAFPRTCCISSLKHFLALKCRTHRPPHPPSHPPSFPPFSALTPFAHQRRLAVRARQVLYNTSVLDVENTLRRTCWKVLFDRGVSKEVREQRAKALLYLGTVFLENAQVRSYRREPCPPPLTYTPRTPPLPHGRSGPA